ncbi:hypothetical protein D3C87_2119560 [compost metagenome]
MMGSQSGSVMSVTKTSPGCTSSIWLMELMTRAGPDPILWPMARPSINTLPDCFRAKRSSVFASWRLRTVSGRAWTM